MYRVCIIYYAKLVSSHLYTPQQCHPDRLESTATACALVGIGYTFLVLEENLANS